ncbi:MAG: threonine/serine exporter family protein [Oscillospiraceae bacterium]
MGYHMAMSGAETFRVEDTVHRILRAYGVECEVFAIPNSISVSLEAANGQAPDDHAAHRLPRQRPGEAWRSSTP